MSEKQKLSDVLKIDNDGVVRPRVSWREALGDTFAAQPPSLSYLRFEQWCKAKNTEPSLTEWLRLHGLGDQWPS